MRWCTLALLLVGCSYRIRVVSDPPGAQVWVGERRVTTPGTIRLGRGPFAKRKFHAEASGYRALDGRLRPVRHEVVLVLVPDHGPVGTWDPDEVK